MSHHITSQQIKEILEHNGISTIDDLVSQLADSENPRPGIILKEGQLVGELDRSWFIKVWELDKLLEGDINELPSELGGNIMKR
ncbi:hypothetical protein [Neolewinella xylanilytica]|uniref:hypothetical protein n=1 Tax=Neolewinella xylanilytica TaxID=1514080 RepID=UPI000CEAD94B|nr:hypothetical protein [Neolewinella xylanilytica]